MSRFSDTFFPITRSQIKVDRLFLRHQRLCCSVDIFGPKSYISGFFSPNARLDVGTRTYYSNGAFSIFGDCGSQSSRKIWSELKSAGNPGAAGTDPERLRGLVGPELRPFCHANWRRQTEKRRFCEAKITVLWNGSFDGKHCNFIQKSSMQLNWKE